MNEKPDESKHSRTMTVPTPTSVADRRARLADQIGFLLARYWLDKTWTVETETKSASPRHTET